MTRKNRWIQGAHIKQGALHRQLGVTDHISYGLLNRIRDANIGTHVDGHKVTTLLKRRVNFALNVRR